MKGSPLFRACLVVLALLALIFPLRSLTAHRSAQAILALPLARATTPVLLRITSTTSPFRFEISHLGKTIWKSKSNDNSIAKEIALPFPSEGIDLVVDVSWTEQKETAVRVEVTKPDNASISKTLWGIDHVSDTLTFAPAP
jgi:hypothetical protein